MNPFYIMQVTAATVDQAGHMRFDWTIQMGDLIMFTGSVITIFLVGLKVRDQIRDLVHAVGAEEPPSGLIGKVAKIEMQQDKHHMWLVRNGLDRRQGGDRRNVDNDDDDTHFQ